MRRAKDRNGATWPNWTPIVFRAEGKKNGDKTNIVRVVPGGERLTYVWIGDEMDRHIAELSGSAALKALALAILAEQGRGKKRPKAVRRRRPLKRQP